MNSFMTKLLPNDKFRLKVTDKCNMHCYFCHAEGVKGSDDINAYDKCFLDAAGLLRTYFRQVHITGGEPTLLGQRLDEIVDVLLQNNYEVALTTNGLFHIDDIYKTIEKLMYVNVSLHSFEDNFTSLLCKNRYTNKIVMQIKQNIDFLHQIVPVRINTVVSDINYQNVQRIIDFAGDMKIELKLVPEWTVSEKAMSIITELLDKNRFKLYEILKIWPGSNIRHRYKDNKGQIIEVKSIELFKPKFLCAECNYTKKCQEGFSFIRLEGFPVKLHMCMFAEPIDLNKFITEMFPKLLVISREVKENAFLYV